MRYLEKSVYIAPALAVLVHNRFQFTPVGFHIGDLFALGTAAVQILPCPLDVEINVPFQVVGQEADAAFQRHQFCTPGQKGELFPLEMGANEIIWFPIR